MTKLIVEQIQFVGMNDLEPTDQYTVQKICAENYNKIKRGLKNSLSLIVHIKCYEKEGGKKKYSIHIRCLSPSKIMIESCRSHDWELARAIHKAFEDIKNQINHKFKSDTSRKKVYY